jgi:SAM-dependent methyltransferase
VRGSLAYRRNEAAILRGDVPEKYTRILPHIPPGRVLELGSAEGVLACLLAREGRTVTALERNPDRHAAALKLARKWNVHGVDFMNGDITDKLANVLFYNADTLVAVRMIYYLRESIDAVFAEVAKRIPRVVLCGNRNRADNWRRGTPHEPLGEFNRYAAREGMRELLERHGYRIAEEVTNGDEIVVGVMD